MESRRRFGGRRCGHRGKDRRRDGDGNGLSGYALAYSGLADSYSLLGSDFEAPRESFPQARAAAERARELDNRLTEAQASLSFIALWCDWDFAESERRLQRAIDLDPDYATAHQWYSILFHARGRHQEALEQLRLAAEHEPRFAELMRRIGLEE